MRLSVSIYNVSASSLSDSGSNFANAFAWSTRSILDRGDSSKGIHLASVRITSITSITSMKSITSTTTNIATSLSELLKRRMLAGLGKPSSEGALISYELTAILQQTPFATPDLLAAAVTSALAEASSLGTLVAALKAKDSADCGSVSFASLAQNATVESVTDSTASTPSPQPARSSSSSSLETTSLLSNHTIIAVAVGAGSLFLLVIAAISYWYLNQRRRKLREMALAWDINNMRKTDDSSSSTLNKLHSDSGLTRPPQLEYDIQSIYRRPSTFEDNNSSFFK